VLQKATLQNWIKSNWVFGSQDKDLLVEKMHYNRFNAINKPEIILARVRVLVRFCKLDKCISKLKQITPGHFHAFFILFGI
jgi:hypothetical protein